MRSFRAHVRVRVAVSLCVHLCRCIYEHTHASIHKPYEHMATGSAARHNRAANPIRSTACSSPDCADLLSALRMLSTHATSPHSVLVNTSPIASNPAFGCGQCLDEVLHGCIYAHRVCVCVRERECVCCPRQPYLAHYSMIYGWMYVCMYTRIPITRTHTRTHAHARTLTAPSATYA